MLRKQLLIGLTLVITTLVLGACAPTTAVQPTAAPPTSAAPATTASQPTAASQATSAPAATGKNCPNPHGANGKCKVVLVNSFLGNDYRVFMQQTAVKASKKEPFASEWEELQVVNTENTPEAQNAALENILAQGVDAILLDSVSDTSANDVVQKACEQGVLVVSFDVTNKSDVPCMYRIDFVMQDYTRPAGMWVGKKLNCQGNVILDKGLQGVSIADDLYEGMVQGLKAACGDKIKIAGEFYGQFGPGPQEAAIAALLPTIPQIDGVFVDTTGSSAWKVFKDAGRKMPVTRFSFNNADAVQCIQEKIDCFMDVTATAAGIGAMDTAYRVFHGQDVPKKQGWPNYFLATDTSIDVGVPYKKLELGVNAFPDKPASWTPHFNWDGAAVQLTEQEAYGK